LLFELCVQLEKNECRSCPVNPSPQLLAAIANCLLVISVFSVTAYSHQRFLRSRSSFLRLSLTNGDDTRQRQPTANHNQLETAKPQPLKPQNHKRLPCVTRTRQAISFGFFQKKNFSSHDGDEAQEHEGYEEGVGSFALFLGV
jgi:hypothetical protein